MEKPPYSNNIEQQPVVEQPRNTSEKYLSVDFEVTSVEEETAAQQRKYHAEIERLINNPDNYLDQGGAAVLYSLGDSTVCIKLMRERYLPHDEHDKYDLGNPPSTEAHFLENLSNFSVDGVSSPHFIEYLEGNSCKGIVMEELPAVNLQHVLNRTEQLPDDFEVEEFLDDLEAYIDELHFSKGIAHLDLEARNVMIDTKTSKPRVIDFGRAKYINNMFNEDERRKAIKKDWDDFDKYSKALHSLVDSR